MRLCKRSSPTWLCSDRADSAASICDVQRRRMRPWTWKDLKILPPWILCQRLRLWCRVLKAAVCPSRRGRHLPFSSTPQPVLSLLALFFAKIWMQNNKKKKQPLNPVLWLLCAIRSDGGSQGGCGPGANLDKIQHLDQAAAPKHWHPSFPELASVLWLWCHCLWNSVR